MRKLALLGVILTTGCYTAPAAPPVAAPAKAEPVSAHARTASDPLGFLPIDADVVVGLDTASLRRTALWARLEPSLMTQAEPVIGRFRRACGFDPVPQIEHVAFSMKNVGTPQTEGVLVIAGLQRSQLMGCITRSMRTDPELARIEHNVVVMTRETDGKPVAFAFADARTLVVLVGDRAVGAQGVRDILDAGAPLRSSEMFMALFGRIDVRRHAWFFMNGAAKVFDGIGTLGVHPRAVFGGIDMPAGAIAKVYVQMTDAAEATKLVTLIQSQLTAVKALVEKFEVTTEDADVVVDIALTEDQMMIGANLLGP